MASPVDPSRRTALVRALNQVAAFTLANAVNRGEVEDLEAIAHELNLKGERGGWSRWWPNHGWPLVKAIEAGEYGPYQETGDGPAD
jgi:hypothetical protein